MEKMIEAFELIMLSGKKIVDLFNDSEKTYSEYRNNFVIKFDKYRLIIEDNFANDSKFKKVITLENKDTFKDEIAIYICKDESGNFFRYLTKKEEYLYVCDKKRLYYTDLKTLKNYRKPIFLKDYKSFLKKVMSFKREDLKTFDDV